MCQNSRNEFSFEILILRRVLKRALLNYLYKLPSGLFGVKNGRTLLSNSTEISLLRI